MSYKHLVILSLTLLLFSCNFGFDKSLISETYELISPNKEYTLYRYYVGPPMAFGSGFTVVNILKSDETCDVRDEDILRFGNTTPFYIKWKDDKTLSVKCLMELPYGESAKHQPIKTEIVKWRDWIFNVEYYSIYSTGAIEILPINSYSIYGNKIKFKTDKDFLIFNRDEIQCSLEGKHIYVHEFKMSSFDNIPGLSFSHYDLTAKEKYNKKPLLAEQSFTRKTLPK